MVKLKKSSTSKCPLRTDSTAGLNSEKSTSLTLLELPAMVTISIASSEVRPPTTLGADTPGIHLLLMESTSNETKMVLQVASRSAITLAKSCPACVVYFEFYYKLCFLIVFSIQ